MKRPKGKLTSLKLTALAGVDKPCQEPATAAIMKRKAAPVARTMVRVAKQAVLTSEADGHAHTLDLDDPSCYWSDQLQTSYQNIEGASTGHSHAWLFDPATGAITIAPDSGHTHTLPAGTVVPADVLAVYVARDKARDARNLEEAATPTEVLAEESDGVCMPVSDEESSGKVRVTVIEARAHDANSTRTTAVKQAALNTEKSQMDKDKQIADLTAKNAELEKRHGALSKMSAVSFAIFKSLPANDAEAFLAKSATEQDAAAADIAKRNEEADKVVYVSKSTGDVYRAKDDARLVEMAKRMDAQAAEIKKAAIRKTATELLGKKAPGDDETHDFIVEQLGGNEKAMEVLKGLVAASKIGKKADGFATDDPQSGDAEGALEQLEKGLTEFCKAQSIPVAKAWTAGLPAFTQTEKGAQLKRAYDESLAG